MQLRGEQALVAIDFIDKVPRNASIVPSCDRLFLKNKGAGETKQQNGCRPKEEIPEDFAQTVRHLWNLTNLFHNKRRPRDNWRPPTWIWRLC